MVGGRVVPFFVVPFFGVGMGVGGELWVRVVSVEWIMGVGGYDMISVIGCVAAVGHLWTGKHVTNESETDAISFLKLLGAYSVLRETPLRCVARSSRR